MYKSLLVISFPMILYSSIYSHPLLEFIIHFKQTGIPNILHFLYEFYILDIK